MGDITHLDKLVRSGAIPLLNRNVPIDPALLGQLREAWTALQEADEAAQKYGKELALAIAAAAQMGSTLAQKRAEVQQLVESIVQVSGIPQEQLAGPEFIDINKGVLLVK